MAAFTQTGIQNALSATTGAAVALTWYICATEDGTFIPAYDSAGSAVTQTVAGGDRLVVNLGHPGLDIEIQGIADILEPHQF